MIKKLIFLGVLLFPFQVFSQAAPASSAGAGRSFGGPVDVELLLDASGSMEALVGGISQMDIAKNSIQDTLSAIPADTSVALRVYAHRVSKGDKEKSCQDTELLVPFAAGNAGRIRQALATIQPKGWTPIANSLKAAAGDFRARESQSVIILLSDGEETCGGDPVAEAKNLLAQGFKLTIHTIGFRVDEKARQQLKAISSATGGVYYDATDAASLTENLRQVTQKALFIDKPAEEARGQVIRGGSQYADAVPVQPGQEYRLDHHQKQNQYDYFSFPVKRGQVVKTVMTTQEKGVTLGEGNQGQENDNPYAGLRLVDGAYQEIYSAEVIGSKHGKSEKTYVPAQDQTLYLLVGSSYNHMHKDSPFKIEVSDLFDAGQKQDAGDNIMTALEIKPGAFEANWLLSDQDVDFYKFAAKAGEAYTITLTPQNMDPYIRVEAFDADRVKVAQQGAPNEGAVVRVSGVTLPQDGFISFSASAFSVGEPAPYSISVRKEEGVAAAQPPAGAGTPESTAKLNPTSAPVGEERVATSPSPSKAVVSEEVAGLKKQIWTLYGVLALSWLVLAGLVYLVIKLWLKVRRSRV